MGCWRSLSEFKQGHRQQPLVRGRTDKFIEILDKSSLCSGRVGVKYAIRIPNLERDVAELSPRLAGSAQCQAIGVTVSRKASEVEAQRCGP